MSCWGPRRCRKRANTTCFSTHLSVFALVFFGDECSQFLWTSPWQDLFSERFDFFPRLIKVLRPAGLLPNGSMNPNSSGRWVRKKKLLWERAWRGTAAFSLFLALSLSLTLSCPGPPPSSLIAASFRLEAPLSVAYLHVELFAWPFCWQREGGREQSTLKQGTFAEAEYFHWTRVLCTFEKVT